LHSPVFPTISATNELVGQVDDPGRDDRPDQLGPAQAHRHQPDHRLLPAAHASAGAGDARRHAQGHDSQRLVRHVDEHSRVATVEILRSTGRVRDMIMNPNETGRLTEVISEGAAPEPRPSAAPDVDGSFA
jgi:hypothetical protein